MSRVVLDTNVVVSALLFTSGRLAWVRRAWQHQRLRPLVCRETANELLRVLTYPKFRLTDGEQQALRWLKEQQASARQEQDQADSAAADTVAAPGAETITRSRSRRLRGPPQ